MRADKMMKRDATVSVLNRVKLKLTQRSASSSEQALRNPPHYWNYSA